jgi:hypothetical protein
MFHDNCGSKAKEGIIAPDMPKMGGGGCDESRQSSQCLLYGETIPRRGEIEL